VFQKEHFNIMSPNFQIKLHLKWQKIDTTKRHCAIIACCSQAICRGSTIEVLPTQDDAPMSNALVAKGKSQSVVVTWICREDFFTRASSWANLQPQLRF
jgi:hypothetical protein